MKIESEEKINDFFNTLPYCPIGWGGSLKAKGKITGEGKILEIYIFTKVAEQFLIETKKWNMIPKNISTDSKFVFRGAPGMLWTQGSSEFSYFQINNSKTGKVYELHLGIQVNGASRVLHEIDVVFLEESVTDYAKSNEEFPELTNENVVLAIECKNYLNSNLALSLGREWLGTCIDMFQDNIWRSNNLQGLFVTSSQSQNIEKLMTENDLYYFKNILTNNEQLAFSQTIKKLLKSIENSP